MFFIIPNKHYLTIEQLRTNTLLDAYFVISHYPLKASDKLLDSYMQLHYKTSLKDMCIKLLLSLTFYENNEGNLVLLFKDRKYDSIASLVTYGNGAVPGSKILQIALK